MTSGWPPVAWEERPWTSVNDGESRRRQLAARGPYAAAVPPRIAELDLPVLDPGLVVDAEDAVVALARFDAEVSGITAPFASILLRSESSSSSEIEQLTASPKSIALAELGLRSGPNSQLILANRRAMEAAIALSGDLDEDAILAMQHALLHETHPEFTGRWRQQPVWVGGRGNSPHTATFVPPHSDRVPGLMADLTAFARRADLAVLPQIAIAHAQFETIHPFPDGNGRTGRALVHAMLHRLRITRSVVAPVSAGLLGDVQTYFAALGAYRRGDVGPIVAAFADACIAAVANGRQLVSDVVEFRNRAYDLATARRGSAGWRTIELLAQQPVISAREVALILGVTPQNAQNGIDRLVADGILVPADSSRRNRLYLAEEILAALDRFAERARRRSS